MKYIPENINLLPENPKYASLGVPILEVIKHRQFKIAVARYVGKKKALKRIKELEIIGDNDIVNEYSHKFTKNVLPQINEKEYNLAISFMSPHYFVADKVNAKTKIAWIHTDYSTIDVDVESELNMWLQYDYIVSISDDVTVTFLKKFPSLENKIVLIENILPKTFIDEQAELFDVKNEMPDDSIKLLSIGRFCKAKNFDNVPEMASIIKSKGIDFKWYIIGFGGDESLIKSKISVYKMENTVIILGKKSNPYPYIKHCDIYVQPSRYEGKSIAVRESQIFKKTVIITDYSTAHSQLENMVDGVIVPMDVKGAAHSIAKVIENKDLQKSLQTNMERNDYVKQGEIQKIYDLMR